MTFHDIEKAIFRIHPVFFVLIFLLLFLFLFFIFLLTSVF